ncbi:hypothetical protein NF867_15820, partial [Solitalea sp. MAHUQ-68]
AIVLVYFCFLSHFKSNNNKSKGAKSKGRTNNFRIANPKERDWNGLHEQAFDYAQADNSVALSVVKA